MKQDVKTGRTRPNLTDREVHTLVTLDQPITDVIFRIEDDGQPVAIFPGVPGTNEYDVEVYAHMGQHSSASMAYVTDRKIKPAHPTQYEALKRELESMGYRLNVVKRITAKHRAQRNAEMARYVVTVK